MKQIEELSTLVYIRPLLVENMFQVTACICFSVSHQKLIMYCYYLQDLADMNQPSY